MLTQFIIILVIMVIQNVLISNQIFLHSSQFHFLQISQNGKNQLRSKCMCMSLRAYYIK